MKLSIKTEYIFIAALLAATTLFASCLELRLSRYMTLSYVFIFGSGLWLTRVSLPCGLAIAWAGIVCAAHPSTPILPTLSIILYSMALIIIIFGDIRKNLLYDAICALAIINVAAQVLQLADASTLKPIREGALIGLQTNVNETSVFLAVCLPAFFRRRWAWLLPVPIAGLIMARSLAGVMTVCVLAVIYIVHQRRSFPTRWASWLLIPILFAGAIGYAAFVDHFTWEEQRNSRLILWRESAVIALHKPLGWGFGQYSAVAPLLISPMKIPVKLRPGFYAEVEDKIAFANVVRQLSGGNAAYFEKKKAPTDVFLEAHNEYLEVLFAAGIPGLMIFLLAIGHVLWRGWRQPDRIPFYGFLGTCLTSAVFFSWQIVPIAAVSIVWAALALKNNGVNSLEGM